MPDSKSNRGAAVTGSRMPAVDQVTIGHSPDEAGRDLKSTKEADNLLPDISITLMDAFGKSGLCELQHDDNENAFIL